VTKKKNPNARAGAERVTLEVVEKTRRRRLEFESEEEKEGWEKAFHKSKWYTPYFLLGVLINFILYRAGLDLSGNILHGMVVGTGVPIATMFIFTELHYRYFIQKTIKS
jgi:hypothetical protein